MSARRRATASLQSSVVHSRCVVTVLLLVLMMSLAAVVSAQTFVVEPAPALSGAPIRITRTIPSISSVFFAPDTQCGATVSGGAMQNLDAGGSAIFTIASSVSSAIICDGIARTSLQSVTFNQMSFAPPYVYGGVNSEIAFSVTTPTNTQVLFTVFETCASVIAQATIPTTRVVVIQLSAAGFIHVCVPMFSTVTNADVLVNVGKLTVSERVTYTPNSALRNAQTTFLLGGFSPENTMIQIATDLSCSNVVQGPFTAIGFGIDVSPTLPKGIYEFCIQAPLNSGFYMSGGKLQVDEFQTTPTTIFASRPTQMRTLLDSPPNSRVGIATSPGCVGPFTFLFDQSPPGFFILTLATAGIYYTCVEKVANGGVFVLASQLNVVTPYTINFPQVPLVRGIPSIGTVSPLSDMNLFFTGGTACSPIYFAANATGFAVVTRFAFDTTLSFVTICARTADGSGLYSIATVPIRDFSLQHNALVATKTATFTFDSAAVTAGTQGFISATAECLAAAAQVTTGMFSLPASLQLLQATFSGNGTFYMCIESASVGFVAVKQLTVYQLPTFTPSILLMNFENAVYVNATMNGSIITASTTTTCTSPGQLATVTAPSSIVAPPVIVNLVVTPPETIVPATYALCATFPTSTGIERVLVAQLESRKVDVVPTYNALAVVSNLSLTGIPAMYNPLTAVPQQQKSYYMSTVGCNSRDGAGYTTRTLGGNTTAFSLVFPVVGSYTICLKLPSVSPFYFRASNVSVIDPLAVTFNTSIGGIHMVPFQLTLSGSFKPKYFSITSAFRSCATNFVLNGTVDLATGKTSVLTLAKGQYSLCVGIDAGNAALAMTWNGELTVSKLTALTTTLFANMASQLTIKESGLQVYPMSLSATTTCAPPSYVVSSLVKLSAPPGNQYYVCVSSGSWVSVSENTVQVIELYTATTMQASAPSNVTFLVALDGLPNSAVTLYVPPNNTIGCFNTIAVLPSSPYAVTVPSAASPIPVRVPFPAGSTGTVCAASPDKAIAVRLGTVLLTAYMSPTTIVKAIPFVITSGGLQSGFAMLAAGVSCVNPVWGPVAVANFKVVDVTVSAIEPRRVAAYCERRTTLDAWIYRGNVTMLPMLSPNVTHNATTPGGGGGGAGQPPSATTPDGAWLNRTVPPGAKFNVTVDPTVGRDPYVSRFYNCTPALNITSGIFPLETWSSNFFVCVASPDGSIIYTNPQPTLHVPHYVPTSRLFIKGVPTEQLIVTPLLPLSTKMRLYFSRTAQCAQPFVQGSPVAVGVQHTFTNTGLFWACVTPDNGISFHGIFSFFVMDLPLVQTFTSPVLGLPVCVKLHVASGLYSLIPNADYASPYVSYFTYMGRAVFLAPTSTPECNALAAVATASVTSTLNSLSVCLNASSVVPGPSSYDLCVGTPAQNRRVTAPFQFTRLMLTPQTLVADATANVTVINATNSSIFKLSRDGQCFLNDTSRFIVNTKGESYVFVPQFSLPGKQGPLLFPHTYSLCMEVNSQWHRVGQVVVTAPVLFGISNDLIQADTPTVIGLTHQLQWQHVIGISENNCATDASFATAEFSITRVSDVEARMRFTKVGTFLVCARAPVNNSAVTVWRLNVVPTTARFPTTVAACTPFTVALINAQYYTIGITYIYAGDCCSRLGVFDSRLVVAYGQPESAASGTHSSNNYVRTFTVPSTSYFSGQVTTTVGRDATRLCYRNSTSICVDMGAITIASTAACLDGQLVPNATASIAPDANQYALDTASSGSQSDTDNRWLIGIIIGFVVLLLILLIAVVVYTRVIAPKVVPADEGEDDPSTSGQNMSTNEDRWKSTFDQLFMYNREHGMASRSLHETMFVPVDMDLHICHEEPLEVQRLLMEEHKDRQTLWQSEAYVYDRILQGFNTELHEIISCTDALDRHNMLLSTLMLQQKEAEAVWEDQHDGRCTIAVVEEEERLALAEFERERWRKLMDVEASRIEDSIKRNSWWMNRKKKLMASSSKMLEHLDRSHVRSDPEHLYLNNTNTSNSSGSPTKSANRGNSSSSSSRLHGTEQVRAQPLSPISSPQSQRRDYSYSGGGVGGSNFGGGEASEVHYAPRDVTGDSTSDRMRGGGAGGGAEVSPIRTRHRDYRNTDHIRRPVYQNAEMSSFDLNVDNSRDSASSRYRR